MVDITPKLADEAQVIDGYGAGFFTISNTRYEGAVLVLEEETKRFEAKSLDDIDPQAFADELLAYDSEMEIVLFGTGASMSAIPPKLKAALREQGIGSDVMDSRAVCRTFNILLSESRKVAAFMLPID